MAKARKKTPRKSSSKSPSRIDPITQYARDVVAGRRVAGPYVRDACRRHLEDLKRRDLVWDWESLYEQGGIFRFFSDVLKLTGGQFEGEPFELLPWQQFVVGSLFGWKLKATGYRRFRAAFIETSKGSGKTPIAAGIGLYMLCADGEPRAEVYCGAYNQDQARVLFRPAVAMVRESAALSKRLHLSGGVDPDNIAHLASGSFFRPVSSERLGRGKSGPIPHCALLDEIHEHATNAMVEFLSAGVKHRRQPLILMITNSGSDRQTVCWDYHQHAVKVAAGTVKDDSLFAYVCSLEIEEGRYTEDPFESEACWEKVNPSLPRIPGYDYIRDQVSRARGIPSKEASVRRLNFSQWTDAAETWISGDLWQAVQADLNLSEYEGMECYGGLDLSLASDLTALVLAFVVGYRQWHVFSWFWMPGDRLRELEDQDNMAPRYSQWRDAGYLQAPPGKTIDYEHAANLIGEVCSRFDVRAIAYDRAKIELLRAAMDRAGIDAPLVEHGQGFYKAKTTGLWMPGSIEETEAALKEQRIRVNHNPVLSWNVASAVTQASSIQPTDRYFAKRKTSGRIDGAVALCMAIGAAAMGPPEGAEIVYRPGQMFGTA